MKKMNKTILVTGGLGFIGSHTVLDLLANDYEVIIIDNLVNSHIEVLNHIATISGKKPLFFEADVRNEEVLNKVFKEYHIDAIIHFAGLKAVGESVKKPTLYYDVNINTTLALLKMMKKYNCHNIIFSSSATVYGESRELPFTENMNVGVGIKNPYGETKYINELLLKDFATSEDDMHVILLRYFNPIGAHKSGLLGEDPKDIPNNLMPYVLKVAVGELDHLTVFGDDYDTPDGTCIRDYIHVLDLAHGHVLALSKILKMKEKCEIYNLGTGKGSSVLEIVHAFNNVNHIELPYVIGPRREGDAAMSFASIEKARKELGFEPIYTIEDACLDAFNFIKKHVGKE